MATKTFDAVVIGAGPGGYVAAIRLGQLGKKAALVDPNPLGGVCLNWGCIPSKALIAAANLVDEIRSAAERGIVVGEPKVDVAKLREFKDGVVKKLNGGVGLLEKGNGVEVMKGTATFVGPTAIEVDVGGERTRSRRRRSSSRRARARCRSPASSSTARTCGAPRRRVDLAEIPKRLVCIGGGIIGMELGTVYAKLGSQVTFLEALPQILTGVDPEAVRFVQKNLRQRGVTVHVNAKAKGFERKGGALAVKVEVDGKETAIDCDKILVAVGFRPNSTGSGSRRSA